MSKPPSTTKSLSDVGDESGTARSGRVLRAGSDPVETAKFIVDYTTELSSLARRSQLELLSYLLDMARLEAIRIVQAHHGES